MLICYQHHELLGSLTPNTLGRIEVLLKCCVGIVRFILLNSSRAGEVNPVAIPVNIDAKDAMKLHLATTHTSSLLSVALEDGSGTGDSMSGVMASSAFLRRQLFAAIFY